MAAPSCHLATAAQCDIIDLFSSSFESEAEGALPPPISSYTPQKPVQLLIVLNSYHTLTHQQQTVAHLLQSLHTNYTFCRRPLYQHGSHADVLTDVVTLDVQTGELHRINNHLLQQGQHVKHVTVDRQLDSSHLKQFGGGLSDDEYQLAADSVVSRLQAQHIWQDGFTGQHIKVAIFDTGLNSESSVVKEHLRNVVDVTNWTDEPTTDDLLGHGTFVTSLIASTHKQCPGFAPSALLSVFRVFNQHQLSFSSWFLDAFNYALHAKVNVLNLSIGGPDFLDTPFVDKINELAANNVVVISAIGNDGPLSGTLNNPADMMSVIGVGAIDDDNTLSTFSSRGMTTWELPASVFGRVKPDVVTYGKNLRGLSSSSTSSGQQCRSLSGTSVASPVVAGMITLLASSINPAYHAQRLNVATLKQALLETAIRLPQYHLFEQGAGRVDLLAAYSHLATTLPHVSALPPTLDLTDCPYMWPYCTQPLFHTQLPTVVNITLLNSMCVTSKILPETIQWTVDSVTDETSNESMLQYRDVVLVRPSFPAYLYPYSGWLAVAFIAAEDVQHTIRIAATLAVDVACIDVEAATSRLLIPVTLRVVPRPPRRQRLLFDQFHSLRYPAAYFPRDNLEIKTDTLDWNGDSLYTNFNDLYNTLRAAGYYVDILTTDYTCVDFQRYSTLLLVDPEEEYFEAELNTLHHAVAEQGLSLLVFADWYNVDLMQEIKFYDENTQSWWIPETGGANVPALNALMAPYDVAFSHHVVKGPLQLCGENIYYASGSTVAHAPSHARLLPAKLLNMSDKHVPPQQAEVFIAALLDLSQAAPHSASLDVMHSDLHHAAGRLALYGDSNCIDTAHRQRQPCFQFLQQLLNFTSTGYLSAELDALFQAPLAGRFEDASPPAERMVGSSLERHSKVIKHGSTPACVTGDSHDRVVASQAIRQRLVEKLPAFVSDNNPALVEGGTNMQHPVAAPAVTSAAVAGWDFVTDASPLITSGLFLPLVGVLLLLSIVGHAYNQYRQQKRYVNR